MDPVFIYFKLIVQEQDRQWWDNKYKYKYRIGNNINVYDSKKDKNGIKIIVDGDTITLYFERSLDLHDQRQKISKKIVDLDQKIFGTTSKLKNKSFLNNAPKEIVEKEKRALINYKIELKKLNSILNSIKN